MRFGAALGVALLSLIPAYVAPAAQAQDESPTHEDAGHVTVQIMGVNANIPVPEAPPPPVMLPAPVPLAPVPVLSEDLAVYIMRTTPPADLIRYYWRDTPHVGLMLAIAAREASLGKRARDGHIITFEACSADNPHSTASGLFQTMGFHRALAESMAVPAGEPKLTWGDVTGPDCWDDVRLAFQLYDGGRGLSNWRPLPRPLPVDYG